MVPYQLGERFSKNTINFGARKGERSPTSALTVPCADHYTMQALILAESNSIELSTLRCHAFQERLRSQPRYPPLFIQRNIIFTFQAALVCVRTTLKAKWNVDSASLHWFVPAQDLNLLRPVTGARASDQAFPNPTLSTVTIRIMSNDDQSSHILCSMTSHDVNSIRTITGSVQATQLGCMLLRVTYAYV